MLRAAARRLRPAREALADRRGVAAVEFALIAPLMILLFFGLSELSEAIMASRHNNHASSSLGDLVAQCSNASDTDLTNIFAAATDIMAPLSTTTLNLRVTSVIQTGPASTSTQVQWSNAPPGQTALLALTKDSGVTLPPGLTSAQGDTVVMSETAYGFNFPIDLFNGLLKFDDVAYFKPRKSTQVTYTGSGPGGTGTQTSCYSG